jgi:DNA-binding CsgD family transcriptional regulator
LLGSLPIDTKLNSVLADAIGGAGTASYVDRLIDLVGALVPHDIITVARYSARQRPEFISHRHYSDEMVRKYLDVYYACDPFFDYWRTQRRPGVVPLRSLATAEVKRGQYIAEFLSQSVICDEIGVLIDDGDDCCLGVFLDRATGSFKPSEVECLEQRFPVLAALNALDVRVRRPASVHTGSRSVASRERLPFAAGLSQLPSTLWPELSVRERELVTLILAGHPSATISRRLGIAIGTVKNHRLRIYAKLDITTERELFLQYFDHINAHMIVDSHA